MDVRHIISLSSSLNLLCNIFSSSPLFYCTQTVLCEISLSTLNCLWQFVDISFTLLTLKGVPAWLCPTLGASAVLWGRHRFSKCLREHCTSHFCPVQQGECGNRSLTWNYYYHAVLTWMVLTDHFPSLNDQESCVRVLLYRGANKEAKNKHGQTPFQVHV